MRFTLTMVLATMMVALSVPAFAELQNVEVGGSIRIRGNWVSAEGANVPQFVDAGNALDFVEQRSTVSVKADFTNDVTAFVELDSYEIWGTSTRDGFILGLNADAADGSNNVDVYQAYIETRETFGYPVTARIGRQEIVFGSEWLLGNNDTASSFTGLSHDAITLNYAAETWNVTAIAAKVVETGTAEEDSDTDLYGLYATFTGVENWTIDAYWLFLRDATTHLGGGEVNDIHTLGLRGNGTVGAFDIEAELAYQTGGDEVDYDALAGNLEVGYTFDVNYQPRVYLGAAMFQGGDDDNNLFNSDVEMSFNRLFSDWEYSEFIDSTELSNSIILRGGVSAQVTEKVDVLLALSHFSADEADSSPRLLGLLGQSEHDDDLGWELGLYLTYAYSEDLTVKAGYAHFFADDGVDNRDLSIFGLVYDRRIGGNLVNGNGLLRLGGADDEDADYLFVETSIKF